MNNDSGFPENSRPLDFVFLLPKGVGCTIMPYKERQALLERLRDCITTANFSSFTFATYVTYYNFQKHNLDKHAAVLQGDWKKKYNQGNKFGNHVFLHIQGIFDREVFPLRSLTLWKGLKHLDLNLELLPTFAKSGNCMNLFELVAWFSAIADWTKTQNFICGGQNWTDFFILTNRFVQTCSKLTKSAHYFWLPCARGHEQN